MALIGKLAYYTYFRPKALLTHIQQFGGILNIIRIGFAKRAMVSAANGLAIQQPAEDATEIYFLTGKKFWALTCFCYYSLAKASKISFKAVFIDDGSFDQHFINKAQRQFPGCLFKTAAQSEAILREYLPAEKYPMIHKKRGTYPHLKKLTDVHAGSIGWKLVLDSDMLFFKYPTELVKWIKNPKNPFFLVDPVYAYHYSLPLMEQLTGKSIALNLNVGMAGIKSEEINWDKLEYWISELEAQEGSSYLLEQALSAMIVAGRDITVADKSDYIVFPGSQEVRHPSVTLHHYVAESKEWYYKTAWKFIK